MGMKASAAVIALILLPLSLAAQSKEQDPPAAQAQHRPREPKPDVNGLYTVGGGVSPPKMLQRAEAQYSDLGRKAKLQGTCVLSFVLRDDGIPQEIVVTRSMAEGVPDKLRAAALSLDENAKKTVGAFRFEPATYKGQPVPVKMNMEIIYHLY